MNLKEPQKSIRIYQIVQILSEYATFETMNGNVVTIRLANNNAHVSGFDHNGKDNGISIVISPKPNEA